MLIEHRSRQSEAGLERDIGFRVVITASGEELDGQLAGLEVGEEILVTGFLNRAMFRRGEYKLVIHAQSVKRIN